MNLLQTIRAIEKAAAEQPVVNMIVRNDIFRLNSVPSAEYAVFAWLQGEHSTDPDSGLMTFAFTFFYVDRLLDDKQNEVAIQSAGIETLENILRRLEDFGVYSGNVTFRTFNERFSDECAGVWCTVQLETAKDGICAEDFDANRTITII